MQYDEVQLFGHQAWIQKATFRNLISALFDKRKNLEHKLARFL